MKSILLTFILLFPGFVFSQTDKESIKYLALPRPGMTPVIFAPGLVSLPDQHEFGSVFSSNGNEFYYAVDIAGKAETRFMKLQNNQWTKPVILISDNVFSFNDPMLSPDEDKLFFISDKPLDNSTMKKDYDIWYIERKETGWSQPINAGKPINTDANEYYVSFSKKGTIYFSSNDRGNFDIYASATSGGKFQTPQQLPEAVNTNLYEADVFVAPDESYIIFCADRPEGLGRGDLYISFKKSDGTWTKSKNMGNKINTAGHELCPFVTSDGKYFFYSGNKDIYWVDAKVIEELRE